MGEVSASRQLVADAPSEERMTRSVRVAPFESLARSESGAPDREENRGQEAGAASDQPRPAVLASWRRRAFCP